eukprot:gene4938-3543_t
MAETVAPGPLRQNFGPYFVGRTIGRGAFAKVKVATHVATGEKVAMKVVSRSTVETHPRLQRNLTRELKIMLKLHHPHVTRLFDVVQTERDIILVMEYVTHNDLHSHIVQFGRVPEAAARRMFQQLVSALEYCHRHHVAHRDIKPENVMLHGDALDVKLGDFGFSAVLHDSRFFETSCGTLNYSAPEVVSGMLYGLEADVWSAGVTLYTMLFGRLAFDHEDVQELFGLIKGAKFIVPSTPAVSPAAKDLIQQMVVANPLHRPTLEEVLQHPWLSEAFPPHLLAARDMDILRSLEPSSKLGDPLNQENDPVAAIAEEVAHIYRKTPAAVSDAVETERAKQRCLTQLKGPKARYSEAATNGAATIFVPEVKACAPSAKPPPLFPIPAAKTTLRDRSHDLFTAYQLLLRKQEEAKTQLLREDPLRSCPTGDASWTGSSSVFYPATPSQRPLDLSFAHRSHSGAALHECGSSHTTRDASRVEARLSCDELYREGYNHVITPQCQASSASRSFSQEGLTAAQAQSPVSALENSSPSAFTVGPKSPCSSPHASPKDHMSLPTFHVEAQDAPAEGAQQLLALTKVSCAGPVLIDGHTVVAPGVAPRFGGEFMHNGVLFCTPSPQRTLQCVYRALKEESFLWQVRAPFTLVCIKSPDTRLHITVYRFSETDYVVDFDIDPRCGMPALDACAKLFERLRSHNSYHTSYGIHHAATGGGGRHTETIKERACLDLHKQLHTNSLELFKNGVPCVAELPHHICNLWKTIIYIYNTYIYFLVFYFKDSPHLSSIRAIESVRDYLLTPACSERRNVVDGDGRRQLAVGPNLGSVHHKKRCFITDSGQTTYGQPHMDNTLTTTFLFVVIFCLFVSTKRPNNYQQCFSLFSFYVYYFLFLIIYIYIYILLFIPLYFVSFNILFSNIYLCTGRYLMWEAETIFQRLIRSVWKDSREKKKDWPVWQQGARHGLRLKEMHRDSRKYRGTSVAPLLIGFTFILYGCFFACEFYSFFDFFWYCLIWNADVHSGRFGETQIPTKNKRTQYICVSADVISDSRSKERSNAGCRHLRLLPERRKYDPFVINMDITYNKEIDPDTALGLLDSPRWEKSNACMPTFYSPSPLQDSTGQVKLKDRLAERRRRSYLCTASAQVRFNRLFLRIALSLTLLQLIATSQLTNGAISIPLHLGYRTRGRNNSAPNRLATMLSQTGSNGPSYTLSKITSMNDFTGLYATEKRPNMSLIVYQNANPNSSEPEMMQLYAKAKCVIPAVRNYLYFNSSQVAVVYFGKRLDKNGSKLGIVEGAEDFKIKMIRFLTSEIWPPLLRTDAPDESLGTEILDSHGCSSTNLASSVSLRCQQEAEDKQEQEWFKKSLESSMEVLVYLKRATQNTKYLKVILHNNTHRIHFDIVRSNEEKSRWEKRMLFTRIMDNLESQKAIESYEAYCYYLRQACEMAARHSMELERPTQPMIKATIWALPFQASQPAETPESPAPSWCGLDAGPSPHHCQRSSTFNRVNSVEWRANEIFSGVNTPRISTPPSFFSVGTAANYQIPFSPTPAVARTTIAYATSSFRCYEWMTSLEKPESATLDYKSYMSHPADEIIHRSVKFMCGFLNAYGEGKLVIGVHEFTRRAPSGGRPPVMSKREGKNQILLHNDLVDQFVVGVQISERELEKVQREVSEQLLNCVPPIPPAAMQVDLVPVKFPSDIAFARRVLVLYDLNPSLSTTQDALKQKCNSAIRYLNPHGLSVVPASPCPELYDAVGREIGESLDEYPYRMLEVFLIASISDPSAVQSDEWESVLEGALIGSGKRCSFLILDAPAAYARLQPPPVYVVEVAIDIKQCGYQPLIDYKGKFFSGWPSIPLWDPTVERVREYPRNYDFWTARQDYAASLTSTTTVSQGDSSCATRGSGLPVVLDDGALPLDAPKKKEKPRQSFCWYKNRQVAHRVLDFLYSRHWLNDILHFRLIHPLCNSVFENFQGTPIIKMIYRTPVGAPVIAMDWKQISRFQHSLQLSNLPPMPLLLCRIYELLGNLPSPFPYVAVPMQQQTFRLSPDLVPLYYYQSYYDGVMRIAVALDLRDSLLKMVHLRCGMLCLDTIGGVGFEQMGNYKTIVQMNRQSKTNTSKLSERANSVLTHHSHEVHQEEQQQRRILVNNEHWRDTSMMLPGRVSEGCHQAKREVEPNLPLLFFTFLAMSECAIFSDDVKLDTSVCSAQREQPWTLFTLINWIRSVLMDTKHTINFGYCDRSFAFRFLRIEDICAAHLQPSVASRLRDDGVSFSSKEDCLLHRRQAKVRALLFLRLSVRVWHIPSSVNLHRANRTPQKRKNRSAFQQLKAKTPEAYPSIGSFVVVVVLPSLPHLLILLNSYPVLAVVRKAPRSVVVLQKKQTNKQEMRCRRVWRSPGPVRHQSTSPAGAKHSSTGGSFGAHAGPPRHNPLADQNIFAWGYPRVGHTLGELPAKALETSVQCMSEKATGHQRGASVMDFFDAGGRQCTLCCLPITTTNQAHLGRHEHQARLGILERAIAIIHTLVLDTQKHKAEGSPRRRALSRTPRAPERMLFRQPRTPQSLLGVDEDLLQQDPMALQKINFVELLVKRWWASLDCSHDLNAVEGVTPPNGFCRLSHLSSTVSMERRWRLRYLLEWLKHHGVLQSSLSIANANISPEAFSRSQRFEVLEMVGDCVVKVELPDRLTRLFPHGVCSKLALFQRLVDSNSGLLDIYDWLKLDQIIGAKLANSKAKADVVECIFGELQCFLWATEINSDPVSAYAAHPATEFRHLRAVVLHTMHEMMHAVFMWRLETTMESAAEFIQCHALEFKRYRGTGGKKRASERELDRGRYATLPLITPEAREHAAGPQSSGEAWYQSTHTAVTRAGPQQTVAVLLSPDPLAAPPIIAQRVEGSVLMLPRQKGMMIQRLRAAQETARQPSETAEPPHRSTRAALTYPQWKMEEKAAWERQHRYETMQETYYRPSEVSSLLAECLGSWSHSSAREETTGIMMPDFANATPSPSSAHEFPHNLHSTPRELVLCPSVSP